jgi:hypothetical protein
MARAQDDNFRSVAEDVSDGSKNGNLSYSHNGYDVSTFRKSPDGMEGQSATSEGESDDFFGDYDEAPAIDPESISIDSSTELELARAEIETNATESRRAPAADLEIPPFLDRRHELDEAKFKPGTLLTNDDVAFLESGKFR